MVIVITIIGLLEKNSGKTFVVKNLAKYLEDEYIITPFKPISGSNYWYHPENTNFMLKNKILVSQDLRSILDLLKIAPNYSLTILNPIHSLFHHNGLKEILIGKKTFEEISQMSYWSGEMPILIRYSIWDDQLQEENLIYVFPDLIPDPVRNVLDSATDTYIYHNLEELTNFDKKFSSMALNSTFNHIIKNNQTDSKKSIILVEGFNNIVPSTEMINQSSIILIVAPGIIAITDTERFKKAQEFLKTEFLSIERYLNHSVVEEQLSIPFNPNENDWKQIISQIQEYI